jgi:NADH-quinone oxidoreductase subunit N
MQPHLIEFITVGLGILLLLLEAFTDGSKTRIGLIAAAGLAGILILELTACGNCTTPAWMERFYDYDSYARYFKVIALAATILVLLMSVDMKRVLSRYTSGDDSGTALGEFFCLPVFTCAGLMWMASARDLVSIFVALELVTIAFYVMVAYMRRNVGSLEAGVKYLILGALSTGFLVYGIAWVYGATGTMDLSAIDLTKPEINQTRLLFGLALLLIAFGFKVGAAPMQLWIPDVYQGAPTPVTAYLSVASKAAGFVVMMMVLEPFLMADSPVKTQLQTALYIIAGATLLYGNLAAISQENFKRLLAYSSIAHAGFLLMGIGSIDFTSVAFYLGIYLIMTFTAFFILALVRDQENSDTIDAFDGLGKRNPLLASCLTISMAALAGIPLTAGFWGKFFIFKSAIETNVSWWLIAIAFVSVATGFYYYLKVVKAMYWNNPHNDAPLKVPTITKYVIAVLASSIIIFGIWPQPILDMLK